jgi:fumarate hydratase subunit beta
MEKKINLPTDEKRVKELKLGDIVYLNGIIYTARDEAHLHALELYEKKEKLPVDFKGSAVFHCGPIMRKKETTWEVVVAGPTTSTRMNKLEPKFIEFFRPSFIIGKGGMSKEVKDAMQKLSCAYLSLTGGAAVLAAKGIAKVLDVHWYELGMPEALWVLEAKKFGPLIVAIDAHGNSLYENVNKEVEKNILEARKKLGL